MRLKRSCRCSRSRESNSRTEPRLRRGSGLVPRRRCAHRAGRTASRAIGRRRAAPSLHRTPAPRRRARVASHGAWRVCAVRLGGAHGRTRARERGRGGSRGSRRSELLAQSRGAYARAACDEPKREHAREGQGSKGGRREAGASHQDFGARREAGHELERGERGVQHRGRRHRSNGRRREHDRKARQGGGAAAIAAAAALRLQRGGTALTGPSNEQRRAACVATDSGPHEGSKMRLPCRASRVRCRARLCRLRKPRRARRAARRVRHTLRTAEATLRRNLKATRCHAGRTATYRGRAPRGRRRPAQVDSLSSSPSSEVQRKWFASASFRRNASISMSDAVRCCTSASDSCAGGLGQTSSIPRARRAERGRAARGPCSGAAAARARNARAPEAMTGRTGKAARLIVSSAARVACRHNCKLTGARSPLALVVTATVPNKKRFAPSTPPRPGASARAFRRQLAARHAARLTQARLGSALSGWLMSRRVSFLLCASASS